MRQEAAPGNIPSPALHSSATQPGPAYRGLVGGKDKHKLLGRVASAVEEGAEGVARVLGHAAVTVNATLAQEGISLVDKEEEAGVVGGWVARVAARWDEYWGCEER